MGNHRLESLWVSVVAPLDMTEFFQHPSSGGTTYCALASLQLAKQLESLSAQDRQKTVRWLVQNQASNGGFRGRTNKDADACYCFWCGASLHVSSPLRQLDNPLADHLFCISLVPDVRGRRFG